MKGNTRNRNGGLICLIRDLDSLLGFDAEFGAKRTCRIGIIDGNTDQNLGSIKVHVHLPNLRLGICRYIGHTDGTSDRNIVSSLTGVGKENIFADGSTVTGNVHFASTGTVKPESTIFDPSKKFGFWITFDGVVGFDTG